MKPAEIHAKWKILQQKIAKEFDSDDTGPQSHLIFNWRTGIGKGTGEIQQKAKRRVNAYCHLSIA